MDFLRFTSFSFKALSVFLSLDVARDVGAFGSLPRVDFSSAYWVIVRANEAVPIDLKDKAGKASGAGNHGTEH